MSNANRYALIALALIASIGLTACERALAGAEKDMVLTFSEPATDNMIAGLAANDYAVFSRDFDTEMQQRVPASEFVILKHTLDGELGNYVARRVQRVTQADEFYVVTYAATFEHADGVEIAVAFHVSDRSIAVLGINSAKVSWFAYQ